MFSLKVTCSKFSQFIKASFLITFKLSLKFIFFNFKLLKKAYSFIISVSFFIDTFSLMLLNALIKILPSFEYKILLSTVKNSFKLLIITLFIFVSKKT